MNFTGQVCTFETSNLGWNTYIPIPEEVFEKLVTKSTDKRVVCTLNNTFSYHCAMMPKVTFHYVMLNNEVCKKLNLHVNDEVQVELVPDTSTYGMHISEEMEEVLDSDPEGSALFHHLTPGKIRSLIHVVNKTKSSQIKIEKSFVILDHLKNQKGILDFRQLNEDFKNYRNKTKF